MKKLINRVDTILDEQLHGFVAAHPGLTLHRDPTYITRADAPVAGKVGLICGGGSGHEPMHSGYIGDGMLDGAVPGEIFTSPTPDQVLACAEAVDSGRGVLLIIKNYTGDVLNFETATELLHDMGHPVAVVLTDDDVAVKDSLYTAGRRGVAGTVLIEKLLGAAARRADPAASMDQSVPRPEHRRLLQSPQSDDGGKNRLDSQASSRCRVVDAEGCDNRLQDTAKPRRLFVDGADVAHEPIVSTAETKL